jgi:hypothetical protein
VGKNVCYKIENYKKSSRVLVVKLTSCDQILKDGQDSIHQIIQSEELSKSVGIYFYRFKDITKVRAFSKIGEVSRKEGIIKRKKRGWLQSKSNSDTYKGKNIHTDIHKISSENPMYFTFYEFDIENSFPKIDEIHAFGKHKQHFKCHTTNSERINSFLNLGKNLIWYGNAFDEVLNLKLPSGNLYP